MWFALWSVLVVGAIVVPVLLGVDLWRRLRALGREASAFTATLADSFGPEHPESEPPRTRATLFEPDTAARARRELGANRAVRSARRSVVLDSAVDRWSRLGLL